MLRAVLFYAEENMNNETLYIVIPAYNEADNIASVINNWCDVFTHTFVRGGNSR